MQRRLFICIHNSEPLKLEEIENYPAHWCVEVFSDDGDYGDSENEKQSSRRYHDPAFKNGFKKNDFKNDCLLCPGWSKVRRPVNAFIPLTLVKEARSGPALKIITWVYSGFVFLLVCTEEDNYTRKDSFFFSPKKETIQKGITTDSVVGVFMCVLCFFVLFFITFIFYVSREPRSLKYASQAQWVCRPQRGNQPLENT